MAEPNPAAEAEAARILAEYARRQREIEPGLYEPTGAANLWRLQTRMRWSIALLRDAGLLPLGARRILEVGCGDALWLSEMAVLGANPANLAGIDLVADRIAGARRRFGIDSGTDHHADFRIGDATAMPWADGAFDVVMQSTVFSSILDRAVQRRVAAEMRRVLMPGGVILWYDFRVDNPRNKNVKGVSISRLRDLFPGSDIRARAIALAPPISRAIVPKSWLAASALESLKILNTSLIATISK